MTCKTCNDTGMLRLESPNHGGKDVSEPCPDCQPYIMAGGGLSALDVRRRLEAETARAWDYYDRNM